jgi:hypothetical protein
MVASYDLSAAFRLRDRLRKARANLERAQNSFENADRWYRKKATEESRDRRAEALRRLAYHMEQVERLAEMEI